jgi:hypothetical protein
MHANRNNKLNTILNIGLNEAKVVPDLIRLTEAKVVPDILLGLLKQKWCEVSY